MREWDTLILVRLGAELTIKSRRTRTAFLRRLSGNVRDALGSAGIEHGIELVWGRMFVRAQSQMALAVLARVFGISSLSWVERQVSAELDTLIAAAAEHFREGVSGRRFAVRARRTGRHPYSSKDVEIKLGAALYPYGAGVDLTRPEFTAYVEVRDDVAYLFSERTPGTGGLPLGVEGKAVALVSGGYDSAVAAWLMLKRGVALDYVFCNLGGDAYERAVVQVAKVLADDWSYGTRPLLHAIDFADVLRELRDKARASYWQVVLKRLMYRAATHVASEANAEAVVTGEAIGQVSSQTLTNLRSIEDIATLPVLRPLVGADKEEIIDRARVIGTAALSEQVREYCAIAPGYPVTAASIARVDAEENKLDLGVLERAVAQRKLLDLRSLTSSDLAAPYLFVDDIPEHAVVIDCRPATQFKAWHLKGARHMEAAAARLQAPGERAHVRALLRARNTDRVPRGAHAGQWIRGVFVSRRVTGSNEICAGEGIEPLAAAITISISNFENFEFTDAAGGGDIETSPLSQINAIISSGLHPVHPSSLHSFNRPGDPRRARSCRNCGCRP
jgi:thiamine biosynthesis protein ThiI